MTSQVLKTLRAHKGPVYVTVQGLYTDMYIKVDKSNLINQLKAEQELTGGLKQEYRLEYIHKSLFLLAAHPE